MGNYKQGFSFLWQYSRNKKKFIIFILIVIVIASFLEGFSISLLAPFFQNLSNSSEEVTNQPAILRYLNNFVLFFPRDLRFVGIAGSLIIAILLKNIFKYVAQRYTAFLQTKVSGDIRKLLVQKILNCETTLFQKYKYADLIDRLNIQATYCGAVFDGIIQLFSTVFVMMIMVGLLIAISFKTTITVFLGFFFISTLIIGQTRIVRSLGTQQAEVTGQFSAHAGEVILGVETVRLNNRERYEKERLNKLIDFKQTTEFKSLERQAVIEPFAEGLTLSFILGVLIISKIMGHEQMPTPIMITYVATMVSIFPLVKRLNSYIAKLKNRWGNMERVINLLKELDFYQQKEGEIEFPGFQKEIRFENVGFYYPDSNEKIFEQCDFTIKKGGKTALIGPSGIGKTTIVKLFMRFYNPTKGKIIIDGIDLNLFDYYSFREKVGIVSQDIFLFHDNIWNNIAYGKYGATDDQIFEAAKKAHAHEFINNFEMGYQTIIGDRGMRLSGGQRQRIAIARAILKDPEILIFDEATSALDNETEALIQDSLELLSQNKTILTITHRHSTIKNVDMVLSIKNKRIKIET
jgi:ATP-binding cassette, subfamily B, bacterial MsbA